MADQERQTRSWRRFRRMCKPGLFLLHGEASETRLGLRTRIVQWMILIVEFFVTSALLLSVTSGFKHNAGAILVAFVSAINCWYLWQPTVWGKRRKTWWIKRAGLTGVGLIVIGALFSLRINKVAGEWTLGWHAGYIFAISIAGIYFVAWGFIRTVIVEAVE